MRPALTTVFASVRQGGDERAVAGDRSSTCACAPRRARWCSTAALRPALYEPLVRELAAARRRAAAAGARGALSDDDAAGRARAGAGRARSRRGGGGAGGGGGVGAAGGRAARAVRRWCAWARCGRRRPTGRTRAISSCAARSTPSLAQRMMQARDDAGRARRRCRAAGARPAGARGRARRRARRWAIWRGCIGSVTCENGGSRLPSRAYHHVPGPLCAWIRLSRCDDPV